MENLAFKALIALSPSTDIDKEIANKAQAQYIHHILKCIRDLKENIRSSHFSTLKYLLLASNGTVQLTWLIKFEKYNKEAPRRMAGKKRALAIYPTYLNDYQQIVAHSQ